MARSFNNQTAVGQLFLVIFGISGDLSRRKILPALLAINEAGQLPPNLEVVGISRQNITIHSLFETKEDLGAWRALEKKLSLFQMDTALLSDYDRLMRYLKQRSRKGDEYLFYLAVPPQVSKMIVENLGRSSQKSQRKIKLLLEKPFGRDLASAQHFIRDLGKYFEEEQVYRIDHYLAKEMVQNILTFRSSNSLFRRVWDSKAIESVEIIASERIGIEGRQAFYEQTGALRDILQSHLLQLLALVLMELPDKLTSTTIHAARLKALEQVVPLDSQAIARQVKRGQYRGYRQEVGNSASQVETFVWLRLYSRDRRWRGVPLTLITGKALDQKTTEIRLKFKEVASSEANQLIFRIQPKEGVEIDIWAKQPGYEKKLNKVQLTFAYDTQFAGRLPEAYEQVLIDCWRSDKSLFASAEEIVAAWRLLQPVLDYWQEGGQGLRYYNKGSSPSDIMSAK